MLEHDGVLRHYVYPNSSTAWSVSDSLPSNICLDIAESHTGGGACDFNSICSMGADGRPSCACPGGYSSRGEVLSGCVPDFAQHRCDQQSQDAQNFRFNVINNVDWPVVDYVNFMNVNEEWCRQSCLDDCYCVVAIYYSDNCYKKALPFTNGRYVPTFDGKAFIKVRTNTNNPNISSSETRSSSSSSTTLVITLSVLLGCSVLLYLLSSVFFVFFLNRRTSMMALASRVPPDGVSTIRRFSFDELEEATPEFKEELGRGACSTVYKGSLKNERDIAVKKLNWIAKQSDIEFIAEVSSISRTNHKNLVKLLGYCDEGQHRILVYEFMTNKSLANFLFQNSSRPSWHTRGEIAVAVAGGLC